MGDVLKVPGGCVTILSKYDLIELIRSCISDDVADYVDKHFRMDDDEQALNELYFNSDYKSMEESCDEYTSTLSEITFLCKDIQCMLANKRIDKNKISEKVRIIENTALEVL